MFLPLPTPNEMSLWDKTAVNLGVSEVALMENASREALYVLLKKCSCIQNKYILIFMGSGNNGGDAVCLARHIYDMGAELLVIHTKSLTAYKGTTLKYISLAKNCDVPFMLANDWLDKYYNNSCTSPDIIIDGLLGTGLSDNLREQELKLITCINQFSKKSFILALDIPSGLSGLTGKPQPIAVKANITVTFEAAKPGLVLPEAKNYVGSLYIQSIGIPILAKKKNPHSYQMLSPTSNLPLPVPDPLWHKGNAGHVLVIGGVSNQNHILTGAPHLTALAALRTGAGLVTIAAPYDICYEIKANSPEIMMKPLGTPGTRDWSEQLIASLSSELSNYSAIVIGPGMGRGEKTTEFIGAFLTNQHRAPTVIDADALIALSTQPCFYNKLRSTDILTPHPGEAAILLQTTSKNVQKNRFIALKNLQQLASATWILKGAGTLVASLQNPTVIFPTAIPNLAVGGSGDILAGCLGTLLAQNVPSYMAACFAVQLHIETGIILAKNFPYRGNIASDIIKTIPIAYTQLLSKNLS